MCYIILLTSSISEADVSMDFVELQLTIKIKIKLFYHLITLSIIETVGWKLGINID
jgi:hypothetical protein